MCDATIDVGSIVVVHDVDDAIRHVIHAPPSNEFFESCYIIVKWSSIDRVVRIGTFRMTSRSFEESYAIMHDPEGDV